MVRPKGMIHVYEYMHRCLLGENTSYVLSHSFAVYITHVIKRKKHDLMTTQMSEMWRMLASLYPQHRARSCTHSGALHQYLHLLLVPAFVTTACKCIILFRVHCISEYKCLCKIMAIRPLSFILPIGCSRLSEPSLGLSNPGMPWSSCMMLIKIGTKGGGNLR